MSISRLRFIAFFNGISLLVLSISMLAPVFTSLIIGQTQDLISFVESIAITATAGIALVSLRNKESKILQRDMYLITVSCWIMIAIFSAIPFHKLQGLNFADSFFESMSSITTTGSTVIINLEESPKAILIWRSMLQWLGGIGFIAMAVAILPLLKVGGMKIFQTESLYFGEKSTTRIHISAKYIIYIYIYLTFTGFIAFYISGMNIFDSINHAMTSISTGGLSTRDNSMASFNWYSHWVAVVLMIAGSIPFPLYVSLLTNRKSNIFKDEQVRAYLLIILCSSLCIALWLFIQNDLDILHALHISTFNVVSIVSTTGFFVDDYSAWGSFSFIIFFYLMFIGGCSGSTSGSIKIFRFQIAWVLLKANLNKMIHTHAVLKTQYNGYQIDDDIINSILTFSFFFTITTGAVAVCLSFLGIDPMTSLSGAVASVTNVGPGFGGIIGPTYTYSSLPDSAKFILSIGMLFGRLEIITVLIVLSPWFWKR